MLKSVAGSVPEFRLESVLAVTPRFCTENGILALILDLDGTTRPHPLSRVPADFVSHIAELSAGGILVGIASNNVPYMVEQIAEEQFCLEGLPWEAGWLPRWRPGMLSWLGKRVKPDPEMFVRLQRKFSRLAGEEIDAGFILVVGDLEKDIAAGRAAGMRTALVNQLPGARAGNQRSRATYDTWLYDYWHRHGGEPQLVMVNRE